MRNYILLLTLLFSSEAISGSLRCNIFNDLYNHPALKEFPVVVEPVNHGFVTVVSINLEQYILSHGVTPACFGVNKNYFECQRRKSSHSIGGNEPEFKLTDKYQNNLDRVKKVINNYNSIKDIILNSYTELTYEEVFNIRNKIIKSECLSEEKPSTSNNLDTQPDTSRKAEIITIQTALKKAGYDPGPIDGIAGLKTKKALKELEEKGTGYFQNEFGDIFFDGKGVSKDINKAAYWYRKAAEQGNATAQNNLGVIYDNGMGVSKDLNTAVYWYQKSAEQGYTDAQNNIGAMYLFGTGVNKDLPQAFNWFRKAAEQGDAYGQKNLGLMYENGDGVDKNLNQAIYWFRKSAQQGDENAQQRLRTLGKTW